MRRLLRRVALVLSIAVVVGAVTLAVSGIPAPWSFTTQGVPRVSWRWAWKSVALVQRLQQQRSFAAWYAGERKMFVTIGTRRAVHLVAGPGAKPEAVAGLPTGARYLQWSRDTVRRYVTYALDEGGSERYRLFRYDLDTGLSTPLTTQPARAYASGLDRDGRRLTFASNERNGTDTDVYVVDVQMPETKTMVYRGSGDYFAGWIGEDRLLVGRHTSVGRTALFTLELGLGTLQPLFDNAGASVRLVAALPDRRDPVLYLVADLDGEFASVHALDLNTGQTSNLVPSVPWDVVDIAALSDRRTLALLVNEDARHTLHLFDLVDRTVRRVAGAPLGFMTRLASHPTLPLMAVDVIGLDGISGVWTYDVESDRFEPWAVVTSGETLPEPEVIHYPTFDTVNGRPRSVPAVVVHTSARRNGRRPVVIDIHGGPTAQSVALVQPADSLMYAGTTVIRPNVRGSTGYGKTYESLDDRERREDAVRDIGALLDWIATRPDLDRDRVGVIGGSYGGYMSLATLVHYGDRLRCGVDLFGISDFPAFLRESEQGHYPEAQRGEYGDWRDARMLRFLESISPAARADRIRVPIMIYQGANDVRVKPQQSRSMVERIRAAAGRVTYIEAPNEGHGLDQPLTQFYVGVVGMEFMSRCLRN